MPLRSAGMGDYFDPVERTAKLLETGEALPDDDPKTRNGGLDPAREKDIGQINMYMKLRQYGQMSDQAWAKLIQRNPKASYLFSQIGPSAEVLSRMNTQKLLRQYASPGTPDRPYTDEDVGSGIGPYAVGQTIPGKAPQIDYQRAIAAAIQSGNSDALEMLAKAHKLTSAGKGGEPYGGVQYAQDKNGNFIPYLIDKNTYQPIPIQTPQGTSATVPMVPQQVALPGGQTTVVQIPSRGVPQPGGGPKPSGLTPAHPASMDAAGKIAMLNQASSDITGAMGMIFKDGKYNKELIAKMNVPFTAGLGGDARIAYSKIHNAIAAKLRAETGAAANRDEVENIARRFMPTLLDNEESARDKMTRLQEFMDTAVDTVDPNRLFKRPDKAAPANSPEGSVAPKITPQQAADELRRRGIIK